MLSIIIATVALLVSIFTLWINNFRRGRLKLTQPVLFSFLYELPSGEPKVFLRASLYTTGKRGHVIEGMYIKLKRQDASQIFDFWMYGETKNLMIGSGLRVGEDGVSYNHHFVPPKESVFDFEPGEYTIEVYARVVNHRSPILLSTVKLQVTPELAIALRNRDNGVIFTRLGEAAGYRAHISHPPAEVPTSFLDAPDQTLLPSRSR